MRSWELGLGSRWDYSVRTQIIKEGAVSNLLHRNALVSSRSEVRNFLIDVILKVRKFTVMIRTDAYCFGNILQIWTYL